VLLAVTFARVMEVAWAVLLLESVSLVVAGWGRRRRRRRLLVHLPANERGERGREREEETKDQERHFCHLSQCRHEGISMT
jgi:hypothetical protein